MKEDKTDNTNNSVVVSTDPQIVTASENGRETTETEDDKRRQQSSSSHKKRSKNWTRQETLRLIRLRSELEPRFARSGRKSELWDEISVGLQGENICRDAQQCRDKWEKLTAGYKEVRDGLKSRHDNPFFDDLHPLLSARAKKENVTVTDAALQPPAVQQNPIVNGNDDDDDGERTEEEDDAAAAPSAKRRRCHYLTGAEVDEILENLFVRQQSFFRELLDTMERKEQMREQIRQEKEDRWRAEERAHRCTLNNAMVLLTRKLLQQQQQQQSAAEAPPVTQAAAMGMGIGRAGSNPKKRSKNWKRAEVLRLIKFRGEMEARFVRSSRRAALWEEVAEMLAREGIRRDGKQCREKWDKLVAEYKEVAEGKREQRDSPYFQELTAILRPPADVALHQQEDQQQMDIL
ncbi:hypothetical protein SUGI_0983690 [Cryptomeria japonica]|uniref:trihelix transcription factor DF1 n=1 Tax=Cryptomeria japonica TaxID=3369 RepID=UPI002414A6CD|nr:trihelix transcription factor DF1 [Cryptomeria japonica]GLJ46675.1 hypothetical protein SUGI_0983690 [Cryptomeria japonica]